VVEIDVPTLAAIGRVYESFDRNLTRSLDDIYQSDPELRQYAWTGKQLKAMSGAVAVLATGYAKDALFTDILLTLRDPFVRAELIRDWSGEATQAFGAMQGQLRRPLLRSGVLSVVLATYRYTPPQAAQFWPAVCHDSGLTEVMPARALVHFLLTTPSRLLGAPEYARHVASAWNAFYEQRVLRTIVPRAGANPIRIAGTPHDGTTTWQYLAWAGLVQHTPRRKPAGAARGSPGQASTVGRQACRPSGQVGPAHAAVWHSLLRRWRLACRGRPRRSTRGASRSQQRPGVGPKGDITLGYQKLSRHKGRRERWRTRNISRS
jgi:hypothetical protein